MHPNPNKREIPIEVANYVTKKISYGLGWTTIDRMTPKINPFPSMLNIQVKITLRDKGNTLFQAFEVDPR